MLEYANDSSQLSEIIKFYTIRLPATIDIVPEFKWEDGQAYRLRSYSMRASASLAINGDESLIYYQSLPQQVSKFNRGSSAYFRKLSKLGYT